MMFTRARTGRDITPQAMHEPERKRVSGELLRGADIEPDAPETGRRLKFGTGQVGVIVPQHAAVPRRIVGGEGREQERERLKRAASDSQRGNDIFNQQSDTQHQRPQSREVRLCRRL